MLTINVVTLFPEVIAPFLAASIPGRAAAAGQVSSGWCSCATSPTTGTTRWTTTPYGGGAGMVLKPEPFFEAVESRSGRRGPGRAALGAGPALRARRRGAVLAGSAS